MTNTEYKKKKKPEAIWLVEFPPIICWFYVISCLLFSLEKIIVSQLLRSIKVIKKNDLLDNFLLLSHAKFHFPSSLVRPHCSIFYLWMSKTTSNTNSSIRLKRDHQTSELDDVDSSTINKKVKQQNLMEKETRNRYANGSSSAFLSSNSTKKLVIKNLKSSSREFFSKLLRNPFLLATSLVPPPDYFEKIWPLLKQALEAILNGTTSPTNEEQLYRHIDHLCTTSTNDTNSSLSSLLYENLRKVLDEHVQTFLPRLLR